jgi:hypothetical protein
MRQDRFRAPPIPSRRQSLRDRDRGDDVPSSFCKKTFKQNRYVPERLKPKALIAHSKDGCERMPVMNAG